MLPALVNIKATIKSHKHFRAVDVLLSFLQKKKKKKKAKRIIYITSMFVATVTVKCLKSSPSYFKFCNRFKGKVYTDEDMFTADASPESSS